MPTPPTTVSPGVLFLDYIQVDIPHTCGVRLVDGVDLMDLTALAADAAELAAAVAAVLPVTAVVTGWGTRREDGTIFSRTAFDTAYTGEHATDSGMPAYLSAEITLHGKASPTSIDGSAGHTSLSLFTTNAFPFNPGQKVLSAASDADLSALKTTLSASLRYYADKYGQKADCLDRITIQFNAHMQKRAGS